MKKIINSLIFIICILLFVYIVQPTPEFPEPPADSVQSSEPADTEDPMRRAYFTNLTRKEVIDHYQNEFNRGFTIYTPRLNYPPEESATIIRDQTMSTYLEEIAHPFRESIYINGFEPKSEKDTITIDGKTWHQKIIIKYVTSTLVLRVLILGLTIAVALLLMREYKYARK